MADLAVGLSKAAYDTLVNKVKTAIKEEAAQWLIVQRDLVFITGEFEMMQSFLNTADEERVRNHVVRTWVRQVRDLSYDVEDCIEYVLHLDTNRSWWSWWPRVLPSCSMEGAQPVDEAVTEIIQLKARVQDVSQRNIRYSLVSDSSSKSQMQQQYVLDSATGAPAPALHILVEARETALKCRGLVDLTKLVTEKNDDLQVISLWGPRDDLQTMCIIRNAYDDSRVCKNFRCRAWVKVVHPFNPQEFIRSLLAQFYANSCHGQGTAIGIDPHTLLTIEASTGDLVKEFVRHVNTHAYLIILEDLSTMVQWDAIRPYLPEMKKGSRIIVSTRHHEIASLCTGKPYRVVELLRWSIDQSICVFFNESFNVPMEAAPLPIIPQGNVPCIRLVGRDSETQKLQDLIMRRQHTDKPHVVSVWGFLGSGRSAVVFDVYQRCIRSGEFYRCPWLTMPQPFDLVGFCRCMLSGVPSGALQAGTTIQQCRELLHNYQCLVVIDDMQSKEAWELIKAANLICGDCRSCIVVVTTEESVATHCAGTDDQVCSINCLQATAALDLLKQTLQGEGIIVSGNIPNAEDILFSCGGFPRVIVAIGWYLARKRRDIWEWECRLLRENFMQQLQTNSDLQCLRGLLIWMHFYIRSFPPSLKKCMLYLLIFPRRVAFRRRRLVRRWIAEGYAKGTESNSLEESAGELFHKLASQSVMQQAGHTAMETLYMVNGFIREYIISQPMETRTFFPLEVSALGKRRCILTTESVGQHLAVREDWERTRIVFDNLDFSRLRSFTVFGVWQSFFITDKMRVLRVLDLEGVSNIKYADLELMVQLLPRLKFLSLRGCSNISRLPDSLGDLRQLQTLDIRYTSVVKLPTSIIKLRKLQYIRVGSTISWTAKGTSSALRNRRRALVSFLSEFCKNGTCTGGVKVPRGMGKLSALHTLGVVDVSAAAGKAILDDLRNLTQLRKLGVSGISSENIRHLILASHLESLSLHLRKYNHVVCTNGINLPRKLQSLKLYGHVENLPRSIKDLHNLKKLSLKMITLKREGIQVLGMLKKLSTLRLYVNKVSDAELQFGDSIDADHSSPGLFLTLQVLRIACINCLHVMFGEKAMTKLQLLDVHCYGQPLQLSGLDCLISLKQVWLSGSYDDTLKEALQQELDKHKNEPVLKLEK